jgi:predicted helicase
MSQHLVNQYLNELDRLKKVSGSLNEQTVREAFKDLLKSWARQSSLVFVAELEYPTKFKTRVSPDGTILHSIRVPLGYWEAKDTKDDLDEEIARKTARGYPQSNIIYENGHTAVLIQNREEVMRCDMTDPDALLKLVTLFFGYEREEIAEFRRAVEKFKGDLPHVLEALREQIDSAYAGNAEFQAAAQKFLKHAKDTINPAVTESDVREMLIQHILTEEIFAHVFDQSDFHRENNIARELYALEARFFTGAAKRNTLKALEPYYAAIRANAAAISTHAEKQTFLKVIYENFYKVYNPKAADRLGVVYTPNEIVRFMIDGADWLCKKHFGKHLIDNDVEILDPATGTGTFICELLEHFRGQPQKLAHKYKNELHANEVAILPYYVANLNIEATYAAITGQFAEFPNLCFVDTLDNVAGLGIRAGHQHDLFASFSEENVERVKRQNRRKISVIIGNPPYNANQQNENENNKNREYSRIDQRIRETYIRQSSAQKTKAYDMYSRFFRWASDRLHDDGVIALVTNRSFVSSRTFDGFRRNVASEFSDLYVVDLGGDIRANPKLSGTKHNVFGIQTGIAISFLVKERKKRELSINYARRPENETAEEKLSYLSKGRLALERFEKIIPDKNGNWLNQQVNSWESLTRVISKETKLASSPAKQQAIFRMFSLGVVTARDDWVYDFDELNLARKVQFFIDTYTSEAARWRSEESAGSTGDWVSRAIKWTSELEAHLSKGSTLCFSDRRIRSGSYRPYVKMFTYYDRIVTHRIYQQDRLYPIDTKVENTSIVFTDPAGQKPWLACIVDTLPDLHYVGAAAGTVCAPRYCFDSEGTRLDNITDWGLKQFQAHYEKGEKKPRRRITKDDIFHYVYGVLHDPVYRETYAINLKREFPRIPFYPDFWAWAEWGECLMALHIGYEAVEPWPLARHDLAAGEAEPLPRLKADKDNGTIQLDTRTTLSGVPAIAWTYRLGNRSALEWVLDQYKEKKPKDPTIAARFNTYRFKDHKEKVADLLARVTRVSVETMEIVGQMASARRE